MEISLTPSREVLQIKYPKGIHIKFKVEIYGSGQLILGLNLTEMADFYRISNTQVSRIAPQTRTQTRYIILSEIFLISRSYRISIY